jgi:DNA repair photolyase
MIFQKEKDQMLSKNASSQGTPGEAAKSSVSSTGSTRSRMYPNTTTWNPYRGCTFDCTYCTPSFKKQAKRQMHRCQQCYDFVPHVHEDRLDKIPSADNVFVSANGDISFCAPEFTRRIIASIKQHNIRCPDKTYLFQSKRPEYFEEFLELFPDNVVLLTTLETNRDAGYESVSKAPVPTERHRQFKALDYARKVVTIEPVMDFDLEVFARWIIELKPEHVWLGFNSKPKQLVLPEPTPEKVRALIRALGKAGVPVKGKDLRGMVI